MATRRYTNRRTVSRELSDAAKIAKMEAFIGKEVTAKLVETYGPYAYDIYRKALSGPAYLMPYTDGQYRASKATISYLAENELTTEQLGRIIQKPVQEIEESLNKLKETKSNQTESLPTETEDSTREEYVSALTSPEKPFSKNYWENVNPEHNWQLSYPIATDTFNKRIDAIAAKENDISQNHGPISQGKTLTIGDSRTVGIASTGKGITYKRKIDAQDKNGNLWFAEEGKGLSWMQQNEALIKSKATDCNTVIINLGTNDIGNNPDAAAKKYIPYMNELAKEWKNQGKEVIFISVNPVDDSRSTTLKNKDIERFNQLVKAGLSKDITFIDTYSELKKNPKYRLSPDGLHNVSYAVLSDTIATAVNNHFNKLKSNQTDTPIRSLSETILASVPPPTTPKLEIKSDTVTTRSPTLLESSSYIDGKMAQKSDSITATAVCREINANPNFVGVISGTNVDRTHQQYWGIVQHNYAGAQNIALYAATHPEYSNIANRFFDTSKPGYQQALQAFKNQEKKGVTAYCINDDGNPNTIDKGSPARENLLKYLKPNYRTLFQTEGKNNPQQFTQLQRDVTTNVTATFYQWGPILNELKKKGINPTDVNPTVWGMLLSAGIARGNIVGASSLFAGKTIEEINSPQMIDAIRNKYKNSVFRANHSNEVKAYNYAKEHIGDKHSITTAKELSAMLKDPSVFEYYLAHLPEEQKVQIATNLNTSTLTSASLQRQGRNS